MSKIATHDDYIATAAEPLRPALTKLHKQLRSLLPNTEEVIAWNQPGFAIDGKVIVGYAAFSKQCGIYLNADTIALYAKEIAAAGFKATKTGITFGPSKSIPEGLLKKLVQASRESLGY